MATIKKNDFVEVEYTGQLEDGTIFDTTNEAAAKESGIFREGMPYGRIVICVGEGQILPGLESELIGKETGKDYEISLAAEKAFGKKSADLLTLVPARVFTEQNIRPFPGLQITIDGNPGTIRTVSGGRIIVDFNHPLAGKAVKYDIKVDNVITDTKRKIESYIMSRLNMKGIEINIEGTKAQIKCPEIHDEVKKHLSDKLKELVPDIKDYEFTKI